MTTETSFPAPPGTPAEPEGALAESARGWHRIQLAVLGFIGFCGVLWAGGDSAGPRWVQLFAAGLVILSLALACFAIYLVGRVAHPLSNAAGAVGAAVGAARGLRLGVLLTYLAVAVLVVATLTAWWPGSAADAAVAVRDTTGRTWCGELLEGPAGQIRLKLASGLVTIPVEAIAEVRPVRQCD